MKKSMIVFLILTVFLVGGCLESGIEGKYVNTEVPGDYMELNSDGTFFVYQQKDGFIVSGTYEINDKQIFLILPSGLGVEGKVEGKNIIDNEGIIWKKE